MRVLLLASFTPINAQPAPEFVQQAYALADRMSVCAYTQPLGLFDEQVWQSGATLEAVSNVLLLPQIPPRLQNALFMLLNNSFEKTPVIVDSCFDDHVSSFYVVPNQARPETRELTLPYA